VSSIPASTFFDSHFRYTNETPLDYEYRSDALQALESTKMATYGEQGFATGTATPDELRRRNVATSQPNGSALPIEVDEKTKQKVGYSLTNFYE